MTSQTEFVRLFQLKSDFHCIAFSYLCKISQTQNKEMVRGSLNKDVKQRAFHFANEGKYPGLLVLQ